MSTTANGSNSVEDAEMADCDGEKVVTMVDVLKEQEDFEEDANAVLGASDDKNCTFNKGYVKRQAIYACVTCCTEAKDDPSKRAGVCLACSLNCHENHELIELYTKRNFRCDCGNSKFNSHPCQFTPYKTDLNDNNNYNQNFSGLYCTCQRPYPDPESNVEDEMIQCIICEDWLHASHLEAAIPSNDQYSEMICKSCMEKNPFLHDYSELAVIAENADVDVSNIGSNDTEKLIINGINKDGENDSEHNPSCSTKQSVIADGIKTVVSSCTANTILNENSDNIDKVINDSDNADKLEKQSSTATNSDPKNEMQDIEKREHKEHEEEDISKTLLEPKTEEEKQTTSEITNELQSADTELNNGKSINENSIETSEITNTLTDETKDSDKTLNQSTSITKDIREHRNLAELSLEDNIQDLADLINEKSESDSTSKLTEASSEPFSKTSNQEDNKEGSEEDSTEPVCNQNNIQTTMKLPNTTGNELQITPGESTSAASETKDIIEACEKSAEMDAQTMESVVAMDLKADSEIIKEKDNGVETTNNTEKKDSKNTEVNSIEMTTEVNSNHIESKDVDMSGDNIVISENHSNETVTSKPSEIEENCNETLNRKESENKRKLSTENVAEEKDAVKRTKPNEIKCARPKEVMRIHKGATFWPLHFRQKLCTCNECLSMYKDLSVLFLTDLEDTVSFYENLGKEKVRIEGKPKSQYEKGLEALSSLDRVQQINALTEYNRMRDKLLDFLKSFKDKKEIVKEEDIKEFFANMKPKREPDGVYFCR